MQDNIEEPGRFLALDTKSQMPEKQETSESLPKNVSMQLYNLMKKVVEDQVTPATVRAACTCATEIHRMLKLNLEIKHRDLL